MNLPLFRCCLALLLIGIGLSWAAPAHADNGTITCSANTQTVNFGSISLPSNSASPATQAIGGVTCTNTGNQDHTLRICLQETSASPRQMQLIPPGTGGALPFGLYTDAAATTPLSTSTSTVVQVLTLAAGNSVSINVPLFGKIPPIPSSLPPGLYSYTSTLQMSYGANKNGDPPPALCNGLQQFSGTVTPPQLVVQATVSNQCTVSVSATDIDLGSQPSTATNIAGQNTISVTCPPSTAYYVGLSPSNGNTGGAGVMSGTGSNSDKVPYQLHSGSTSGPIWGNTATSTSAGNGVAATGTGSLSAYAVAPDANYKPDTYTDTVTVIVNY